MFFCKHDWKVLSENKVEPLLITLPKEGVRSLENVPDSMLVGTVITICSCRNCGDLKKFVTET